jgi:hypothetical protein
MRDHRLDFIALLETWRSYFVVPFLNTFLRGWNLHGFVYRLMVVLGVIVGINLATLQVKKVEI